MCGQCVILNKAHIEYTSLLGAHFLPVERVRTQQHVSMVYRVPHV